MHVQALDVSLKASCSRVSSCELRMERIMSVAAAVTTDRVLDLKHADCWDVLGQLTFELLSTLPCE